eukprot:TRINITY_DN6000_c0_g1_i1.p1 TRINITY_DN6000_c0_g1~~TRINITY_DN6000_c0_g1_i1.p1  ORF type:complete len:862 (-),score=204.37 TRINITY_DN6000_c0_g1_i1:42-2597(-)
MLSLLCLATVASGMSLQEQRQELVARLVQDLTLEQKAGQMTQINIDQLNQLTNRRLPDEDRIRSYVNNYFIGSVLNAPFAGSTLANNASLCAYDFEDDYNSPLTPEEWVYMIETIQRISTEEGANIPVIYGIDSVHGANYINGATLFPQQIGLAATFDREHARVAGEVTARDTRAVGIHWNFSPILDIATNLIWARVYETFGEDPFLATQLGLSYILASQGGNPRNLSDPSKVASTAKHFLGYAQTKSGHDTTGSWIDDRFLLEYFVPSFQAAFAAGDVATVMESYSEINGVPVVISEKYLSLLLRDIMGFDGTLVTDWAEIKNVAGRHRVTPSQLEATRLCMTQTSVDMSMVPCDASFAEHIVDLVLNGQLSLSRVDESVTRILSLKAELGLLDPLLGLPVPKANENIAKIGNEIDRSAAFLAAKESLILAKNQILPIDRSSKRILVTGPTANSKSAQTGGWTFHWQGPLSEDEFTYGYTVYDAFSQISGSSVEVVYEPGCSFDYCVPEQQSRAVEAARAADFAVVCIGENTYAEFMGDIKDSWIGYYQWEFVRQIAATGTPVILVVFEGRPRVLDGLVGEVDAVIVGLLPGPDSGLAVAELVFGDYSPSGRFPFSYPKWRSNIPLPYWHRHIESSAYDPEWEFGHGLSYTTFEYSNLVVSPSTTNGTDDITVSVTVRNTGSRPSKEAVLMFLSDEWRTVTPEVKRLRGFEKIYLDSGAQTTVTFVIPPTDLAFYDAELALRVEAGDFIVAVGGLSARITVVIDAPHYILLAGPSPITGCEGASEAQNAEVDFILEERMKAEEAAADSEPVAVRTSVVYVVKHEDESFFKITTAVLAAALALVVLRRLFA